MRNVSNSEVTTWLSCRRLYKYQHVMELMPKTVKPALYRGTMDHEAFQLYVEARVEGSSHEAAMKAGMSVFLKAMKLEPKRLDEILYNQFLWKRYMDFHNGWPDWELIDAEQRHEIQFTETLKMVIRYDVKVRDRKQDKVLIGDWKFHYRFNRPIDHSLNGQMPKYIRLLQANGEDVQGGFLEEVRTEKLSDKPGAVGSDVKNLWRRTYYFPSRAKMNNMLRQHITAAMEIEEFRALPERERNAKALPVLNKYGPCGYCDFAELCNSENDGADISHMVATDFTKNTYGYNHNEEEVLKSL